jgi:hypothetical protein
MTTQIGRFVALPAFGRLRAIAMEYARRNGLTVKGPGGKEMLDMESAMRWAMENHPTEAAAMFAESRANCQEGVAGQG